MLLREAKKAAEKAAESQAEKEVNDVKRKLIVGGMEIETSKMISMFGLFILVLILVLKWTFKCSG